MGKNMSIQNIALDFIENKDNKHFTVLINRLKPGLFSFAYKYVKDKDLAEEVVENTFINIWEKIDQYKPEFNFSTWVYAIAKNNALGILRGQNRTLSLDKYTMNHSRLLALYNPIATINTEVMGPSGHELEQYLCDVSVSAINNLEEPYRTVMVEREINKKQLQDIAADLGWNLSTVKTRLRKARKDVETVIYKKYPDLVDSYFGNENDEY